MPLNADEQNRAVVLARIRGGLRDLGLTTRSPQSVRWAKTALDRLQIDYPNTDSLVYWLPDTALAAWAEAIERKALLQSTPLKDEAA